MGRIRTIERDKLLDAAEAVTMEKGPAGLTIAASVFGARSAATSRTVTPAARR